MQADIDEQVRVIMNGADLGDTDLKNAMETALRERLVECRKEGRPLRVYTGYDPTNPDLHLGHSITLRKMRQFQDFGHEVYFVIGSFTALVGDTSDKLSGRPRKTTEEVTAAMESYVDQGLRILDREKTKVVYNGDWLSKLPLSEFISVASYFTVQQFIVRDNFRKRLDRQDSIGLHEFFYALLQAYDALHLKTDVQLGATEQLFNIMAGRKLQTAHGIPPSICITFPVLVGTDGKSRMSKSERNYVGIAEPPTEQYGKTMSISDETMLNWIKYVTRWPPEKIGEYTDLVRNNKTNPMEIKKKLAWEIVSLYHGDNAADHSQAHFEQIHQQRKRPDDIKVVELVQPIGIVEALTDVAKVKSRSEARRLIEGGGVRLDGETVISIDAKISKSVLLRVGKRRFFDIVIAESS